MNPRQFLVKACCILIGFTMLFFILNVVSATMNLDRFKHYITRAFERGDLTEKDDPGFNSFIGQHQYQDCLVLMQGLQLGKNIWMNALNAPFIGDAKCIALKDMVVKKIHHQSQPYFQYLHGVRTLTVFALSVIDLRDFRFLLHNGNYLLVFLIALYVAKARELKERGNTIFAVTFFSIFSFFHGIDFFGMNLSHGYGDLLVFFSALLFFLALKRENHDSFLLIALGAGVWSAYIEYLVGILPGLICVLAIMVLCFHALGSLSFKSAIRLFILGSICCFAGFLFTYVVFALLKAWLTGYTWSMFLSEFGLRVGRSVDNKHMTFGYELWCLWVQLRWIGGGWNGLPKILLSLSIIGILFTGIKGFFSTAHKRYRTIVLLGLLPFLIDFVWYFIFRNHTIVHDVFMVRLVSYPMFTGLFVLFLYLFEHPRCSRK